MARLASCPVKQGFLGNAPAVIMSVSFSGEWASEIHLPNNQLYAGYLALLQAARGHGSRLFGSRVIESMCMEKAHLHWKADLLAEFNPLETGLGCLLDMEKTLSGNQH